MNALTLRNVSVRYGAVVALDEASFSVRQGSLTALVGPNGAGKSSALNAVMRFVEPHAGTIEIFGDASDAALERVIYVPQRARVDLDFPITVREVVMQGRYRAMGLFGRPSREDKRRVDEALEALGVHALAKRQIGELSGGQRQRTFLARAMAQDGDLILLDEPFAGVDALTEADLVEVLRAWRDEGKAIFVVHHDLSTCTSYFDDVVLLNRRAVAAGPAHTTLTSENIAATYTTPPSSAA